MRNLAGLHDREAAPILPMGTWCLDTIALSENPAPPNYDSPLDWIVRVNWGYGSTGTLPVPDQYPEYAKRAAAYVRGPGGCTRWIVANEPSLSREWPDGQPIFPHQYAAAYKLTRKAIRALPGHEHDEVLIAASGPWNNELRYSGNPSGDWIKNFEDTISIVGDECDGFSIHSYCHGYHVNLVTSSARMQAPFQHRHYEFRAYQDYMEAIPDALRHLPVYLTEANGNGPWQAVGLMPAMLGEIDNWNKSGGQPIKCVIFYRYPKYDDFYMAGRGDVLAEFNAAVGRGYISPEGKADPVQTHIPVVTNPGTVPVEPSLPQREYDPRLKERGVHIDVTATHGLVPGQQYWRVAQARWWNEAEAQGRHHIYVEALDRQGRSMAGIPFLVKWPSGQVVLDTNGRSGFDAGNFPMSKSLNEFSVAMSGGGYPSERVTGIGMGANGNSGIHTSTGVVFQLVTVPATQPTPTPQFPEGPTPAPSDPVAVPSTPAPYTPTADEMFDPLQSGTVTASVLNVRNGPGLSYPIVAKLAQGDRVTLSAEKGDWYEIGNGKWVFNEHIRQRIDEPTPTEPVTPAPSVPVGDTWTRSRAFVAKWEGGYSDNPEDHGNWTGGRKGQGELKGTKYGISAASYPQLDIRDLTLQQADAIYFRDFWQASGADKLHWPYCLLAFDTAVLHGVDTSRKWQTEAGTDAYAFAAKRLRTYTKLDNWSVFGAGWVNRVADLLEEMSRP